MQSYPLGPVETRIVAWTGRAVTLLSVATLVMLASIAFGR